MTETTKRKFASPTVFVAFTVAWVLVFAGLILAPFVSNFAPLAYSTYVNARFAGLVLILVLTALALVRAYSYSGESSTPWYKDGFLLAAVFFWALFPPTWFFTEFVLFEHGHIDLSDGSRCSPSGYSNVCKHELGRLKAYADLASKIWAGMAAVFATTIALSKLNSGTPSPNPSQTPPPGLPK